MMQSPVTAGNVTASGSFVPIGNVSAKTPEMATSAVRQKRVVKALRRYHAGGAIRMGGGKVAGVRDVQTSRLLCLKGQPASLNGPESTGDRRGCGSYERFVLPTEANFHCGEQLKGRRYSQIP
jgi:hypothetical protein